MNLRLATVLTISAPAGTAVLTNDSKWITLGRKDKTNKNIIYLFTCPTDSIQSFDLNIEGNWQPFRKDELRAALEL